MIEKTPEGYTVLAISKPFCEGHNHKWRLLAEVNRGFLWRCDKCGCISQDKPRDTETGKLPAG